MDKQLEFKLKLLGWYEQDNKRTDLREFGSNTNLEPDQDYWITYNKHTKNYRCFAAVTGNIYYQPELTTNDPIVVMEWLADI